MTRETKIGLLVGLAFIIVIGILLSDHLTSSTEPPLATLVGTGANVRSTTTVPGGASAPIATSVTPPQVQPQHPVPTPRELQQPTNATTIVQVGGPAVPGSQPPVAIQPQQAPTQTYTTPTADASAPQPPITIVSNMPPATIMPSQPQPMTDQQVAGADAPNSPLAQVAQQHGEPLVTMTPNGQQQVISQPGRSPAAAAVQTGGARQYVAQSGDSVSKMAARFLGGNTKANRDAIIRVNPSLQQDPNRVVVGKTYRIPAPASAVPAITETAPAVQQPAVAAQPAARAPASAEYWYTVQEGDSLWRIANEQLGDPSAFASIKELNKETLKGGDTVMIGQKLRLPGKPVAQAN